MERRAILKVVLVGLLIASFVLPVQVSAQPQTRRGGLYGDWQIKMKFGENEFESILAFSRNQEDQYTGQWISFWGVNELKDVKFEDNKLNFTTGPMFYGGQERTAKFTGAIEQGELSGLLAGEQGETEIKGKRAPRISRAVGNWEMKFKIGDQEITTTLVIKAGKEDELTAQWQSQWGEHEITDLQYERGKLTFKRKSKIQDRQLDSTFEGTIRSDTLSGVIKSEMGEVQAEGKQIGAPLIGTWNLEIASEQGARKQRLRVNPDMSALYGSTLIKKINLDGDKVSFKYVLQFGDQEYETSFEGKLDESKLTGELTTSRGTRKVKGAKVVRTFRRRNTG